MRSTRPKTVVYFNEKLGLWQCRLTKEKVPNTSIESNGFIYSLYEMLNRQGIKLKEKFDLGTDFSQEPLGFKAQRDKIK